MNLLKKSMGDLAKLQIEAQELLGAVNQEMARRRALPPTAVPEKASLFNRAAGYVVEKYNYKRGEIEAIAAAKEAFAAAHKPVIETVVKHVHEPA